MVRQTILLILNRPPYDATRQSTMSELAEWVADSDRVLTF